MYANYLLILHQCYTVQYSTVIHIATVTYSYKKVRTVSIVGNSNLKKRVQNSAIRKAREIEIGTRAFGYFDTSLEEKINPL